MTPMELEAFAKFKEDRNRLTEEVNRLRMLNYKYREALEEVNNYGCNCHMTLAKGHFKECYMPAVIKALKKMGEE